MNENYHQSAAKSHPIQQGNGIVIRAQSLHFGEGIFGSHSADFGSTSDNFGSKYLLW
jgi:hypothetical protein